MQGVSRAAILAAARNLIAQTGIDTFTLSAVARESGLARNDLYGLFRNKTELLLAIAADDLSAAGHCLRTRQTGSARISLPYEALVTALAPANAPADTIIPEPGPLPGPVAGFSHLAEQLPAPPPVIRQPAQAAERPTVLAAPSSDNAQLDQIVDRLGFPSTPLGEGSATSVTRMDRRVGMMEKIIAELQDRFDKLEKVANDGLQTTETNLEGLVQRADLTEKRLADTARTLRSELLDAFTHVVPPPVETPRVTPLPDEAPTPAAQTAQVADAPPASLSDALMRAAFKRSSADTDYLAAARRSAQDGAAEPPPMAAPRQKPRSRRHKHLLNRQQLLGIGALSIAVILATMGIALSEGLFTAERNTIRPVAQHAKAPAPLPAPTLAAIAPDAPTLQPVAPPPSPPSLSPEQRLEALANGGNAKAALIIAVRYLDADGKARNDAEAARLLERAAKAGEPVAQYRLGTLYQRGVGLVRDEAQALRWYEAAAQQGNRKAMHNLGVFYAEGRGTTQDFAQAATWFLRAAKLGYVDSQFDMGVLHERGAGVPQDLAEAYKWYAIAARSGDADSKTRIEVLASQIDPHALENARIAAQAFRPMPLGRAANVMPQLADLRAR